MGEVPLYASNLQPHTLDTYPHPKIHRFFDLNVQTPKPRIPIHIHQTPNLKPQTANRKPQTPKLFTKPERPTAKSQTRNPQAETPKLFSKTERPTAESQSINPNAGLVCAPAILGAHVPGCESAGGRATRSVNYRP